MLKNAVLDVKKFADGAENEPFEVHKRVGGMGRSLTINTAAGLLDQEEDPPLSSREAGFP